MALTKCKECGKEISTTAKACPSCGAAPPQKTKLSTWIVGLLGAYIIYHVFFGLMNLSTSLTAEPAVQAQPAVTPPSCSISKIQIKSIKAGFVDRCSRSPCYAMQGVAVLTNGCPDATGVELKIVALDSAGAPVAAKDFWPASINNIPPGDYTFSLDHTLQHDARMKSFTLEPIRVKRWQDR